MASCILGHFSVTIVCPLFYERVCGEGFAISNYITRGPLKGEAFKSHFKGIVLICIARE